MPKKSQAVVSEDGGAPISSCGDCASGVVAENKVILTECELEEEEIVVHDEKFFLAAWKQYISEWLNALNHGSIEDDAVEIAGYLCKLARTNLEMTEMCLRSFRRLVERDSPMLIWCSTFNVVLQQVQERVKDCYGGVLKIEPLIVHEH